MRILIAYPGPTHSTFDVAAGYEKALAALGHTVYGFPYQSWLGFYGVALEHWETVNPKYQRSLGDVSLHSSEKLIIAACVFVPEVVLIVSGTALHAHAYRLLHNLGLPVALLLTESPYEDEIQKKFIEQGRVAHAFTNERQSVEWLSESGAPVTYLPHSYDPDVHKPIETNGEHASDVFFHGTLWPERTQLFGQLGGLPYDIRLSGIKVAQPRDDGTLVDNANLARLYNGAAICLNHHRTTTRKLGEHIEPFAASSIGPRAYEIAACGGFQLCDDTRPELWEVFGESVPTYASADDLAERIKHFMTRPEKRRTLADLARLRVQGCTFEQRARDIVEPILGGL